MNIYKKPSLTILLAIVVVPAAAGLAWVTAHDDAPTSALHHAQAQTHATASRFVTDDRSFRREPSARNVNAVPEKQRAAFRDPVSDRVAASDVLRERQRTDLAVSRQMTSSASPLDSSTMAVGGGRSMVQASFTQIGPEKKSSQAPTESSPPPPDTKDAKPCVERSEFRADPNTGQRWSKAWHCDNDKHLPLYVGANNTTLVAYAESISLGLLCYRQGEEHQGGNNIWYYTQGDLWVGASAGRSGWGYVRAFNLGTGTDPVPGVPLCTPDMWQARLTVTDPNTGWSWPTVWYGANGSNVPMYKNANTMDLIGYMDSTTSWFVCYVRGAMHGGGNNVWYYSQGDRATPDWESRRAWGFMPAQYISNRLNPYDGVPLCDFPS